MQLATYAAHFIAPALTSITQPVPCVEPAAFVLPSDNLERAQPRITISTFYVTPGPRLESLMRAAAFLGSVHQYDI